MTFVVDLPGDACQTADQGAAARSSAGTLIAALMVTFAGHTGHAHHACGVGGTAADQIAVERGDADKGYNKSISVQALVNKVDKDLTRPTGTATA